MGREMQLNDNRPRVEPSEPEIRTDKQGFSAPQLVPDLIMGVRFYSRLPVWFSEHERPELDRMAPALPFASLVIGIGPALLLMLGAWIGLPVYFAAALAVAAWVVVTGGMAEDGIADAADGLFGAVTPGRRLEIMRDSRHGTYGVVAIVLLLLLRVTALGAASAVHPLLGGALWLAASVLGRSGSLFLSLSLPHARVDGASVAVGRVGRTAFIIGAALAVGLAFVLSAPGAHLLGFVFGMIFAGGVMLGWTWLCSRLVGGQTGDLIGALQALIEVAALTGFLIFV